MFFFACCLLNCLTCTIKENKNFVYKCHTLLYICINERISDYLFCTLFILSRTYSEYLNLCEIVQYYRKRLFMLIIIEKDCLLL